VRCTSLIMSSNNTVTIETFAQSHFIAGFSKRYKKHWCITLDAIESSLERLESLLLTSRAAVVCGDDDVKLVKTEFRVVGTKDSAKTSGNRCIVAWHIVNQKAVVLLVYSKTDLSGRKETAAWKKLVRENYPVYAHLL